jgi:hypothetical protein
MHYMTRKCILKRIVGLSKGPALIRTYRYYNSLTRFWVVAIVKQNFAFDLRIQKGDYLEKRKFKTRRESNSGDKRFIHAIKLQDK